MKENDYLNYLVNPENKTVHNFINELGAQLNDFERNEARLILNDLYLNGRDDYWICIAFKRILGKGSFLQWKYLLNYEPFIKENDSIYNEYVTEMTLHKMLKELDCYCGFCWDSICKDMSAEDDANIETLSQLSIGCEEYKLTNFKDIIEYYFFKYYLNLEMIKAHLTVSYYAKNEPTPWDIAYSKLTDEESAQLIKDGWIRA